MAHSQLDVVPVVRAVLLVVAVTGCGAGKSTAQRNEQISIHDQEAVFRVIVQDARKAYPNPRVEFRPIRVARGVLSFFPLTIENGEMVSRPVAPFATGSPETLALRRRAIAALGVQADSLENYLRCPATMTPPSRRGPEFETECPREQVLLIAASEPYTPDRDLTDGTDAQPGSCVATRVIVRLADRHGASDRSEDYLTCKRDETWEVTKVRIIAFFE